MDTFVGEYSCDGGALSIYTPHMRFAILNKVGDGRFKVKVSFPDKWATDDEGQFWGVFQVFSNQEVVVSKYDLECIPIFTLPVGWYSVHTLKNGDIHITRHTT